MPIEKRGCEADRSGLPGVSVDQRWFYHPEMQARVADAEAEFREGRATRTTTPEEAQRFLDSLKG